MSSASLRLPSAVRAAFRAPLWAAAWRSVGRWLAVSVGFVLIVIGAIGTVLPGHLGAPVLAVGLVVSLRSSFRARRQFVDLQHRHPKLLFPVRRLLRREPEVAPVLWQALLRTERTLLPKSWRFLVRLRRQILTRRGRGTTR
jgi:hypothetical protein